MATNNTKRIDWKYYLIALIGIVIMFGFGYIPAPAPMTQMGMKIVGIFLGVMFLWTFSDVNMVWPTMLGLASFVLIGYSNIGGVVAGSFGNVTTIMVLATFIIFGMVEEAGSAVYIAQWLLTRRIINGKPYVFTFILMIGATVIAAIIGPVPTVILFFHILYDVYNRMGYKKGDKYVTLSILGVYFAALCGQGALPFIRVPATIIASYTGLSGVEVNSLSYIILGFSMFLVIFVLYLLLVKYVFRPDVTAMKNISVEQMKETAPPPMTKKQKAVLIAAALFILIMFVPTLLPKTIPIVGLLKKLDVTGVCFLFVVALILIRFDGKPVMDFNKVVSKHVPWNIVFVVAFIIMISSAMTAEDTGITAFLVNLVSPLAEGGLAFSLLVLVIAVGLTNVANNSTVGIMLIPIIYSVSQISSINATALTALTCLGVHCAFLTPTATGFAGLLHGNSEWISTKSIYKYGIFIVLITLLVYIVIGIPFSSVLFPM